MLKRFFSDQSGLSAVEFALIAPLLILFFFSTVEIDSALTVDRRVSLAAGTVADLVAQDDEITTSELSAIYTAAAAIMAPFDPNDDIELIITSVRLDSNQPKVVWSRAHNATAHTTGQTVNVPNTLLSGTETVIMAEVALDYDAPMAQVINQTLRMTDTFYLRPRRGTSVCLTSGGTTVC